MSCTPTTELQNTADEVTIAILNATDKETLYDLFAPLDRTELSVVAAGLAGLVLGSFEDWPEARERMIARLRDRIEAR